MFNGEGDEVIKNLCESLPSRYQAGVERSMKGSDFISNYVDLLDYNCSKMNMNHVGSYISSPHWIKNKKATINPINIHANKCYQDVVTLALNYGEIGTN